MFLLGVAYIDLDIPILSDVQSKELQLIYGTDTEDTIKFTLKWLIFLIIVIVGIIRFIMIQYNNKVDKIQTEKDGLEQRLNEETKDLYNKFFELIEYKDRNNIKYSMAEYLQLEPFVLGVQLYTYKLKHRIVFNTVRPKQIMELKINHLESVVAEQEDLNAVVQSYDKINFWLYKELQKVTEKNDLESYNKFIQKYSKKLKKQMDSRSNGTVSNDDVMIFNAIIIAVERSFDLLNQDKYALTKITLDGIDTKKLYAFKRTGLLRVILNGELSYEQGVHEYQVFRNRKSGAENVITTAKDNRVYIGRVFEYNKKNHLILFTLNSELLNENDGVTKMLEIEKRLTDILSDKNIYLG